MSYTTTTDLEVLDAIVDSLVEVFPAQSVFITAQPVFLGLSSPGDEYIEVVPGAKSDTGSVVGHGNVTQEFRVVCFRRLLIDMPEQDTQRLINRSKGLIDTVNKVYAKLTNNFLGTKLVAPLHPVRQTGATSAPSEGSGWASIERVFTCRYLQDFPDIQNDG